MAISTSGRPTFQLVDMWDSDHYVHWNGMRWHANNSNPKWWTLLGSLMNQAMTFDTP